MLLPLLSLALMAAQDAPLIRSTFTSNADGWIAVQPVGSGGKVSVVHEDADLKVGTGSLLLSYPVGPGQIAGAALPVADGAASKMASIHFWVRSAADTPLAITLQEKSGGQYVAMFTAPKGKWQEVELGVQDFTPSTDPGTPADPNGKLDPDLVESITVLDLAQFLAQVPAMSSLLGVQAGDRSLLLSDFKVTTKPLAEANTATEAEYLLDRFVRPQPAWAALNGTARIVSEAPLGAPALRMDYNLASDKAAAVFKRLKPGALAGKATLSLRLASTHDCKLVVQLEEKGGGKYNANLAIPAGSKATDLTVSIPTMTPDPQAKDPNGKLDLDQVGQITLVDVTALTEAPGMNTLWIGKVSAKP